MDWSRGASELGSRVRLGLRLRGRIQSRSKVEKNRKVSRIWTTREKDISLIYCRPSSQEVRGSHDRCFPIYREVRSEDDKETTT